MSKFLLAEKIGMSRLFREDGEAVSVTKLKAGPCVVTQVKSKEKDGYQGVQIGFGEAKKLNKPQSGHLKKGGKNFRHLKEFKIGDNSLEVGKTLDVAQFTQGDVVRVIGSSKGKGFQGVVRRHGFHGHPTTHGHKDQARMPGSIGAGGVQHVRKGMRMAGRMGGDRVTVHNLEVVSVFPETNELWLKGAVPGARHGLVMVISKE